MAHLVKLNDIWSMLDDCAKNHTRKASREYWAITFNGKTEIEPTTLALTLERKGRMLVAMPTANVPPLRASAVERTRRSLTARRGGAGHPHAGSPAAKRTRS
jgi:hypothetical protein